MTAVRRLALPVALVAVLTGGTLTFVSPAQAKRADDTAPGISEVTVAPDPIVLASRKKGTTTLTLSARVADPGGVDRVAAGLYDEKDDKGRAVELRLTSGNSRDGIWSARVPLPNDAKRKAWSVRAFATDRANNSTDPDAVQATFMVQHRARLRSFEAGPDAVAAKDPIVVSGLLQRYKPGTGWKSLKRVAVILEFRKDGAQEYAQVETGKTDRDGAVRFEDVAVKESGRWRLAFAGDDGYAPATSKTDAIAVVDADAATAEIADADVDEDIDEDTAEKADTGDDEETGEGIGEDE